MDSGLKAQLEDFFQSTTQVGMVTVLTKFPQKKMLDLHAMLQAASNPHTSHIHKFTVHPSYVPDVLSESPSKKRKFTDRDNEVEFSAPPMAFASRGTHVRVHEIIKKECEEIVELIDQAKLWITLSLSNISRLVASFSILWNTLIFSLSLCSPEASEFCAQEEFLGELHRAQDAALNLRNIARDDHLSRAKICSKLVKYPNVTDYKHALREHDEGQLYIARHHLQDIRNLYVALTGLIRRTFPKEF